LAEKKETETETRSKNWQIPPPKTSGESGRQMAGESAGGELASQTQTFAINRSHCNCNLLGAISTAGGNLNLMPNPEF